MNPTVLLDLGHNRKRLEYYTQLKTKTAPVKGKSAKTVDKWIEIYAERVKKLERQASRLGLMKQQ